MSRTPWARNLKLFWQFKLTKFQNKSLFFNRLRPTWVTIAISKVDACFWKHILAIFMQKLTRTRRFCAVSTKSVLNVVGYENLGPIIFRFKALWWQSSFRTVLHPFWCFNDLKLGNIISMAPRIVSFDFVFHKPSEKVFFLDFQQGEQGFGFWAGIPSQKSENYEPP